MLPYDSLYRSAPEKQGVSSEKLLDFVMALEERSCNPHALMVLRHGTVVAEGYWRPFGQENRRYLYSLSKSFTSIAVGFAKSEGLLNIEDKVLSFFPHSLLDPISDNLAAMRVRDLLTMTGGYSFDITMALLAPGAEDWVKALLALPVEHQPGTFFLYNSGGSYLLSAVVQQVTGENLLDYLKVRLFDRLGIEGATWETCPRGICAGGWGLSLKVEDLAKFGQFLLQKGSWRGSQLLPVSWIEEATTSQVDNHSGREKENIDWRQGYGYQFWRCQHGAYRGDGAAGQYLVVLPEQEAVVVLTSEVANMQPALDVIWEALLPAFQPNPLPPRVDAQRNLREKLRHLSLPEPSHAFFSGQLYRSFKCTLDDNELGIRSMHYAFEELSVGVDVGLPCSELSIVSGEKIFILRGFHEYMQPRWSPSSALLPGMLPSLMSLVFQKPPDMPLPVASCFCWIDESTLLVRWQFLETPHHQDLIIHIIGSAVQVELKSSLAGQNPELWGLSTSLTGMLLT